MPELKPLFRLFAAAGREPPPIPAAGHLVAFGQRVASVKSPPGVRIEAGSDGRGIVAELVIAAGVRPAEPVHLCFGLYQESGEQDVRIAVTVEPGAEATVLSHCLFSTPRRARHAMQATIELKEGAALHHVEGHFHGTSGDIEVLPHARIVLARGARYRSDLSLLQGRVGRLDVDYDVQAGEAALAEVTARVYGLGSDAIRLRERMILAGAGARGLLKTRVAVRDEARAEVLGIMEGNAAGARGHVDCTEIVRDRAVVSAIPQLRASHPLAKVTHEAAIGSVDSKQLETLLARGLAPEDAVDLIVRGMLA
jgi:hypothetical protein